MGRSLLILLAGLALVHAALFVGPYGYLDLYDYATDAESLWLDGRVDLARPDSLPGRPHYSRFSVGLPVLSGPLVWAGAGIEWVSDGAIGGRWLLALAAPIATLIGCWLVARCGALLGCSPAANLWAAAFAGLSACALLFSRMYFVEPVVGACALGAIAAALVAHQRDWAPRWCALAGACLAAAGACHYADGPLVAGLAGGIALAMIVQRRWAAVAALALAPTVSVAALAWLNHHRFGNATTLGYRYYTDDLTSFSGAALGANLLVGVAALAAVPWLAAVMVAGARALRAGLRQRWLAATLGAAFVAQSALWLAFDSTWEVGLRYTVPMIWVAAVALPLLVDWAQRRWGARAPAYALAVCVLASVLALLRPSDDCPPFVRYAPDPAQPPRASMATWYADRSPYQAQPGYVFDGPAEPSTYPLGPLGTAQWTILTALAGSGLLLIGWSLVRVRTQPEAV